MSAYHGLQRWVRALWVRLPGWLRRRLVKFWEPRFLVSVIVLAFDGEGRVLCVRHVFRPAAYPWGLPSGFLRRGESPAQAALRELEEETGFRARLDSVLELGGCAPDQVEIVFRATLLDAPTALPRSFEIVESGLFSTHALPDGFLRSNLELLRRHGF